MWYILTITVLIVLIIYQVIIKFCLKRDIIELEAEVRNLMIRNLDNWDFYEKESNKNDDLRKQNDELQDKILQLEDPIMYRLNREAMIKTAAHLAVSKIKSVK